MTESLELGGDMKLEAKRARDGRRHRHRRRHHQRFVAEGRRFVITGRRKEKLEQQAAAFPVGSVAICPGDVSSHEDAKRMVAAALALGGGIDILVNNAASDVQAPVAELDPDDWRRILEINSPVPSC